MYDLSRLPEELKIPAAELCETLKIPVKNGETPVYAQNGKMSIEKDEDGIKISYETKPQFFRMLAKLTGDIKDAAGEYPRHSMLCYMIDQSRNAVSTPESARLMIRCLAAMGYDSMMLYTEDTYEIESQPYFGYMRGRWTKEEIRELVKYGETFGIELIPCIQVLAHLEHALHWGCYSSITDTGNILLVGDDKTYQLIDDMMRTAADCFKSRRINIGMDEAHMLGLGKYLDIHGYRNRSDIMLEHLDKVCKIAEKYGFHPMIWSDMFFRLAFGCYYVKEGEIPKEVIDRVPENLTLIYWDYYTTDADMVTHMVNCHKSFNNPVAFAGGCHKWLGFIANNIVTYEIESMHIDKCLENGINSIIATGWGDDGGEAPQMSILPGLMVYAEKCYRGDIDREYYDRRVEQMFKIPMRAFELMDGLDYPPGVKSRTRVFLHKKLLYADILTGLMNKHIIPGKTSKFYADSEKELENYCDCGDFAYVVRVGRSVAGVISLTTELAPALREAYKANDKAELKRLANDRIPLLIAKTDRLLHDLEHSWHLENRSQGLETHQIRLGGMKERLRAIKDVLNDYCDGKTDKIAELEQDVLYYDCRTEETDELATLSGRNSSWRKVVTVNII